jgi:hypothetical protein
MSDVDKRKHAKVIDGLSKPYNNTLINVLKSVKEEPTLNKAEELLISWQKILRVCTLTSRVKPPLHSS